MTQHGDVVEVVLLSRGSQAVGDYTAGDTAIMVDDPTPFDETDEDDVDTGGSISIDGVVYEYGSTTEAVNPDTGEDTLILNLSSALTVDVIDTMPVEVYGSNQDLNDLYGMVDFGDGEGAQPILISSGNRKDWEALLGLVAPPISVEVDDAMTEILDAPGYTPAYDGASLATQTVTSDALTTSAAGDDIVNGTFEDPGANGSAYPFAAWRNSWWFGTITESHSDEAVGGDQIAGSRSLTIIADTDTAGLRVITDRVYPVRGGQVVQVDSVIRASRLVDRSTQTDPILVEVVVHTSDENDDPESLPNADVVWQPAIIASSLDTTATALVSGPITIPDGHTKMRISVGAHPSGDGSGWSLIADEIHKRTLAEAPTDVYVESLSVGGLQVDSTDQIMIGGQTLTAFLAANFTPAASPPTAWTTTATAIRTYDSAGALIASDSYAYVGYAGGENRKAGVWFNDTLIASTLAGKTISKVEAYAFVGQRASGGAGTLWFGYHGDHTVRSTQAAIVGRNANETSSGGWTPGTGKWVTLPDVPSDWASGTKKGLMLGPGWESAALSNKLIYSMRVDGLGKSTNIKLRFTYT